jgi:hypothetical protein
MEREERNFFQLERVSGGTEGGVVFLMTPVHIVKKVSWGKLIWFSPYLYLHVLTS